METNELVHYTTLALLVAGLLALVCWTGHIREMKKMELETIKIQAGKQPPVPAEAKP